MGHDIAPNGLLAAISVHYVKWPTFALIVALSQYQPDEKHLRDIRELHRF